ncbi:MAG: RNA polymerase sigma factor [bacterium]
MRLTAGGDTAAFKKLVGRYEKAVLNFAYRFLGSREEAEDTAQEVFLRVYNSAKTYRPEAQFATWLFRVATNVCLNELRLRKRFQVVPLDSTAEGPEKGSLRDLSAPDAIRPDTHLEQKELNRIIMEAISALPPNQRLAVILKRFERLSYQEIAEVLEVSVSAVESLLFRAKQTLRKKLGPYVQDE